MHAPPGVYYYNHYTQILWSGSKQQHRPLRQIAIVLGTVAWHVNFSLSAMSGSYTKLPELGLFLCLLFYCHFHCNSTVIRWVREGGREGGRELNIKHLTTHPQNGKKKFWNVLAGIQIIGLQYHANQNVTDGHAKVNVLTLNIPAQGQNLQSRKLRLSQCGSNSAIKEYIDYMWSGWDKSIWLCWYSFYVQCTYLLRTTICVAQHPAIPFEVIQALLDLSKGQGWIQDNGNSVL